MQILRFGIRHIESLVEILEEKGVITREEWEKRIKERVTVK
jgi:hypothetical protein